MGVIVHELAHAWLNEHVAPRSSRRREREADELGRRLGYGRYLDALDAETDPFEGQITRSMLCFHANSHVLMVSKVVDRGGLGPPTCPNLDFFAKGLSYQTRRPALNGA